MLKITGTQKILESKLQSDERTALKSNNFFGREC